jgi:hypothetical protein
MIITYFNSLRPNYSKYPMNTSDLEAMDEKQRSKNKSRLLAQNKKLNTEIRNLEKEIT